VTTLAPRSRKWIGPYAGALVALAAGIGALADPARITAEPILFVALLASVLVLDAVRIDLFERLQTSPAALPVLVLAAAFGPLGPLAGEALIFFVRVVRRTPVMRASFDLGALALSGATAAGVYASLTAAGVNELWAGVAAGVAYYAVNMPLLAIVISLSRGGSPLANFREQLAWLLPHYAAFGALAGLFVEVWASTRYSVFLLFGLPTAVLWVAEQQYVTRSRTGVEELRRSHAELEQANGDLHRLLADNQALISRLQQSYLSTITSLARTIEAKDPYTGDHTERVARVAATLAAELGFSAEQLRAVEVGAVIHDIGKIGVPDATLLKPGPLNADERREIERHPEISSYIVAELDVPAIVKQMVRSHHERYDGNGYPDKLQGEEIPLAARILTVADALDAMTSDRPYRRALPMHQALSIIEQHAGTQFCPVVVEALRRRLEVDEATTTPPGLRLVV
jgi:putative nucleotidyltransferase with HDIG domain